MEATNPSNNALDRREPNATPREIPAALLLPLPLAEFSADDVGDVDATRELEAALRVEEDFRESGFNTLPIDGFEEVDDGDELVNFNIAGARRTGTERGVEDDGPPNVSLTEGSVSSVRVSERRSGENRFPSSIQMITTRIKITGIQRTVVEQEQIESI